MNYIKQTSYGLKHSDVTPWSLFDARRKFLKLGAAALVSSSAISEALAKVNPEEKKLSYKLAQNVEGLKLNTYEQASTYNNFYEFSTSKEAPAKMAHTLKTDGWEIEVTGLVEKETYIDMDTIFDKFPLEERIYRFRCVEGWSMVVPWIGFELGYLLKKVGIKPNAKYVKFTTLHDPEQFPDQKRGMWASIPYPYIEGLRIDEALNPLTLICVGMYGRKLPKQNGAPIRLIVPWKYGFKSIKSIVRIELTDKEPINTWKAMAPNEYGFYANVNPNVDHPRWSQAKERVLGKFFKQDTLMFNGYEDEVGYMYKDMDLRKFY